LRTGSDGTRAQPSRVVAAVGLVTGSAATFFAGLLWLPVCIGWETHPVEYGSVRGEACDFFLLQWYFWPYVIGVGVTAYVWMLVLVQRRPGSLLRQVALVILVPAVAVLAVPLAFFLLPRQ
jgi:hypothetical protein